jgi:DNA ligase (NAD+)
MNFYAIESDNVPFRVRELENLIRKHKQLYYLGNTEISDEAYDLLEQELRKLCPDSYALNIVGHENLSDSKIQHEPPMLSLDKIRDPQILHTWIENNECIMSYKIDGSSASLRYENGMFVSASTRGNGEFGENITEHFLYIDFPRKIQKSKKDHIEIRGEVCISKNDFENLSNEMVKRGLEKPKSIRNIVAGLLHKKSNLDLCKYLTFLAYKIENTDIDTYRNELKILEHFKFTIPKYSIIQKDLEAYHIQTIIDKYASDTEYSYLTDGLVFSFDSIALQKSKGFTSHHPRGKIAFKLQSEVKQTKLLGIDIDVGRTGQLSFTGIVEPVELSGAMVERVTLHNKRYIEEHQINIGCTIEITRSGEVIPKHMSTVTPNGEYVFPSNCPICGSILSETDTQVTLICKSLGCPARGKAAINHWIKTLKIDTLGESTIDKLWDAGLLLNIKDIYSLTEEKLCIIEKMGDKLASKIVSNIKSRREVKFPHLLDALGIDGLGTGISKVVVRKFTTFEALLNASVIDLTTIEGIGDIIANNIYSGLHRFGFELLKSLVENKHIEIIYDTQLSTKYNGLIFVITGDLSKPRDEVKLFIETNGGKVTGSVSKKTNYLVCNDPSNSSKYKKAQELNIPIITETILYNM